MTKVLLVLTVLASFAEVPRVTGNWELTQTTFDHDNGGQRTAACTFEQDGHTLSGTCADADITAGDVNVRAVTWQVVTRYDQHNAMLFYRGDLESGSVVRGTWRCPRHCENAAYKEGTFVLRKQ